MADEQQQPEEEVIDREPSHRFQSRPTKFEFGAVASCPRCHGKGKEPGTKDESGIECVRCDGYGVVPNKGPIGYTRR